MKISQARLKQIIREELQNILREQDPVDEPADIPIPLDTSSALSIWRDLKEQKLLSRSSRGKPIDFADLIDGFLEPAVTEALGTWGLFSALNFGLSLPKERPEDKPKPDPKKVDCYMKKMSREPAIRKLNKFDRILSRLRNKKEKAIQRWLDANYEVLVSSLKEGLPRASIMQLPLYKVAEAHAKTCGGGDEGEL
jgi:hypothetical protein